MIERGQFGDPGRAVDHDVVVVAGQVVDLFVNGGLGHSYDCKSGFFASIGPGQGTALRVRVNQQDAATAGG